MTGFIPIGAEALVDTIESASAVLKAIYTTFLSGGTEAEALRAISADFQQFDRLLYLAAELVSQAEDTARDLNTEVYLEAN